MEPEALIPHVRSVPHDDGAERSVLGALMHDARRVPEASETLEPRHFYAARHRILFETIVELADRNQAVDLITVRTALQAKGELTKVGGAAYLAGLAGQVPNAAHLSYHLRLVAEAGRLRSLIDAATKIISLAHATNPDPEAVTSLLDIAEDLVFDVNASRESGGAVELGVALTEAFKRIEDQRNRGAATGLVSGFFDLDEMLGGFNPGELTIIAARPSMGKTAFVLNLMEHAALKRPDQFDHDPVILFFSLEMGRLSIVQRMLCSRARVDAFKMRTGKIDPASLSDLTEAAGELKRTRLFIDDTPGLSIMSIRSRARRVKKEHDLDMIVIDYLQLMSAKAESRQQEISLISRSLKELSRELKVPLIALSQLSRGVESREDKRPQLSDLRESGSIEQDADVVLMLYRPEYYNATEENKNQAEVICAKQRNGPTGSVKLQFKGNILRFENPAHSVAEPIIL